MAPAAFRPLRHRRFAIIWATGAVSNIGTWMETVAVGSLVKASTGKDSAVALVAIASFLPLGVLSPVGGALADRIPRRPFLIAMNVFEAFIAACLAWVVFRGDPDPMVITGLVFLAGCSGSLRFPFQQALLPELVPPEDVLGAVSLGAAQYNAGRVIGPALAAAVIAAFSFTAAFAVNAVSFFAVVAGLLTIKLAPPVRHDDLGIWARIRQGAAVARREPGCRSALALVAVASFLVSPFIALIASRAGSLVADGAAGGEIARVAGLLTTAQGFGAVFGSLAVPTLAERFGRRRALLVNLVVSPVCVILYALAPSLPLAMGAMALVGASYSGLLSGLQAVVQLRAPAAYRGRVVSLFLVAMGTLYPVGALWQGALADRTGLALPTVIGAVALLVVLGLLAVFRRGVLLALEPDPGAETGGRQGARRDDRLLPASMADGHAG